MKFYDTIIIGGGAAAYAAAIYSARYNMKTALVEKAFGGETATAGKIENYPGFKSIDGFELMEKMKEQAVSLGVEVMEGEAKLVKNEYHCFQIKIGAETFQSKTVILAMGMEHLELPIERAGELKSKGVHYCAICDGPLFKGKFVAVVGGGDSAVKAGNQLSDMGAKHVYMIVREEDLKRAEPINLDKLEEKVKAGRIMVLYETEIAELKGDKRLEAVKISKKFEGKDELKLDGVFVEIGATPRGELAEQLGVRLDAHGQIDVDPRACSTSIDGVFAAGDVTNASGGFKQIITGAAQGAIAATSAYKDVSEHGGACALHAKHISGLLPAPKS
ncbi:FAD-dependent oxidoreductase [Candidatus Uhrbacteria bacterium]|nr:FAD-dependent oxidoreductase [Candidatus Uhrbacteria bacterium]